MREEEPVEAPLAEDLVDDPPGGAERAWLGRVGGREGGRAAGPTGGVPAKAREAQQGPVPPGGIARRRERPPAPEARLTPGQVAAGEPCGGKCPRPTTCTPRADLSRGRRREMVVVVVMCARVEGGGGS